ncbi:unnamed protein product [Rotaria magnacalcarata]
MRNHYSHHILSIRSSVVNKSYRCIKAKYLPSSDDDDDDDDTNSNNNLIDELKILSNKKCIYSTNNQYQPLRGDIRNTREIFDGHQWCLIEQKIDYISSTSNSHFDLFTTKINNEENSFQILRLLSNYQIIQDELKKRQKNS